MNAARRSISSKKLAERTFPYRVDIPVPPFGLGNRLNQMHEWCHENVPRGGWAQHGWSERRGPKVDPKEWARFYFLDESHSVAFHARWRGERSGPGT